MKLDRTYLFIFKIFLLVCFGLITFAANAHHATTMFDKTKTYNLTGVVTEVQWTNPHVAIYANGTLKSGEEPAVWIMELTSPGNLVRLGWSKNSFKTGDKVVIEFNHLRNGSKGGYPTKLTLVDTGKSYFYKGLSFDPTSEEK